jgi:hypothetical protein
MSLQPHPPEGPGTSGAGVARMKSLACLKYQADNSAKKLPRKKAGALPARFLPMKLQKVESDG